VVCSGTVIAERVLIVDDDELILKALARILESVGYEARCYQDPLVALANIEADRPVVVISDFMMPGLDGIAFCFLDSEKADYGELYEAVVPLLVSGGLLVADNAVGFEDVMQPMLDGARADARVDAVLVRFLTGQLICRKR